MNKFPIILIGLLLLSVIFSLAACRSKEGASSQSEDEKINIVTTIAQIGEPLSVIGGDKCGSNTV